MDEKKKLYVKKAGYAAVIIFILWLIVRACSNGMDYFEPEYKVGRDGTWYPASLYGKEKNMLGFTNELMLKISETEDFKIQLFDIGYTGLFAGLDHGEFDGVISSLIPSSANKNRYIFSEPIYLTGPVLVVLKGNQLKSLEELEGRTIAFRRGDNIDIDFTKYPRVLLNVYDSYAAAIQGLMRDRVDAILMDAIPAYNNIQGFYSGKMVVATKPLNDVGLRLITLKTPKGQALVDAFNEGIAKMQEDGSFKKILNSWQLIDTEAPSQ